MIDPPDPALLERMESLAVEIARGGGAILAKNFGGNLSVEFKDEHGRDPVTNVDMEAQEYLTSRIVANFPDHGILGEEDDASGDAAAAADYLWVLDPLDGTKNFLHGIPIYACSVGALYKGVPVVGAVFAPWPSARPSDSGGVVHHAIRGGGAYADGEPISVAKLDSPEGGQLATVPGSFDRMFRFQKPLRGKTGDPRVTGSIAYELLLVARGATQYMYTSNPHLWDIVGGVAVALEAGASLMVGRRDSGPMGMFPSFDWRESDTLVEDWRSGETTLRQLRRWARPLVLGNPSVARPVSSGIGWRFRPAMWFRMRRRRSRA